MRRRAVTVGGAVAGAIVAAELRVCGVECGVGRGEEAR